MFSRITAFVYGVVCYLAFFATFLYAIGFLGNFVVPKSIDSGPQAPFLYALAINAVLLALFALQHSVMARPWFKAAWTRIVPSSVERSTYVLASSVALIVLFALWQPLGGMVWSVSQPTAVIVLYSLCAFGWLLAGLLAASMVDLEAERSQARTRMWRETQGNLGGEQPARRTAVAELLRRATGGYLPIREPCEGHFLQNQVGRSFGG